MSCENCGNRIGFAFGTCCQCGWNDFEKKYDFIQVNPAHITDPWLRQDLIDRHDRFVIKPKKTDTVSRSR